MDKSEAGNVAFLVAVIVILVAASIYVNVFEEEEEEGDEDGDEGEETESYVSIDLPVDEGHDESAVVAYVDCR